MYKGFLLKKQCYALYITFEPPVQLCNCIMALYSSCMCCYTNQVQSIFAFRVLRYDFDFFLVSSLLLHLFCIEFKENIDSSKNISEI